MSLGKYKALIEELFKSFKWILKEYFLFSEHMKKRHSFISVKPYKITSWHIGYKYFIAKKNNSKYFIKTDSIHKIIKNEYIVSKRIKKFAPGYNNLFIEIKEYGNYNELEYIIEEFIKGNSLDNILNSNKVLSIDQKKKIQDKILQTLRVFEQCNIIHRDLRPANIIISNLEEVDLLGIKIIDFTFAIDINGNELKEVDISNKENIKMLIYMNEGYRPSWNTWDDWYSAKNIINKIYRHKNFDISMIEENIGKWTYVLK